MKKILEQKINSKTSRKRSDGFSTQKNKNQRPFRVDKALIANICLIVGLVFPFAFVLLLYLKQGTNAPFGDEWVFFTWFERAEKDGITLKFIWDLLRFSHNEIHRMTTTVTAHLLIWKLTHCNDVVTMLVCYGCLVASFGMFLMYGRQKKIPLIFFLPVPVLIFSLKQAYLLFWPGYLTTYLLIICSIASFFNYYRYNESQKGGNLILTLVFSVLGTYTRAEGTLIWIVYAAFFLMERFVEGKKFFTKPKITILVTGAASIVFYFYGCAVLELNRGMMAPNVIETLRLFIVSLSSAFIGWDGSTAETYLIALPLGGCIFATTIFFLCRIWEKRMVSQMSFPLLNMIFFMGGCALTVFGRGSYGFILGTQYAPNPIWFVIALYLLIVSYIWKLKSGSYIQAHNYIPVFIFIVFFAIQTGYYELETAPFIKQMQASAYAVQHYDEVPGKIKEKTFPAPNIIDETVAWCRENRYFLFGSDKEYIYPYDDYVMAEQRDNFAYPVNQIEPGFYNVDLINGATLDGTTIETDSESGLDINMWATDSLHSTVPTAVLIEVGGKYHELKPYERPGIAQFFEVDAYVNSGFRGCISTQYLTSGIYPLNLIVICEEGESFYSDTVAFVTINQ